MADDTTYYISRITGERISPASILAEELAALQEMVESGKSQLTDANVGSEIRNLLESMAYSQYSYQYDLDRFSLMLLIRYAEGEWLDDLAWQYGLIRKKGNRASGIVRFSISAPLTSDYIIPMGTRLLNKNTGNAYVLTSDISIPAGSTSVQTNTGLVIAEGIGTEYNCDAYTITVFDTEQDLRTDLQVTNLQPFNTGEGEENDEQFRNRILAYIRGGKFGSLSYYESLCMEIDGVHDVNFVAPEVLNSIETGRHTIKINNTTQTCNDCTAVCVVNLTDKDDINNDILNEIQTILTNQNNLILGHEFHVQLAYNNPLYFKIDYYAEKGQTVTEEAVFDCLTTFFYGGTYEGKQTINYTGTYTGGTIYKADIIDCLENMNEIHHVEQLTLLGWHKDMSTIDALVKYKSTATKPFTYKNILDYPDWDDITPQQDGASYLVKNTSVPCWKKIDDPDMNTKKGEEIYQLVIDGYYFYKVKDNTDSGDDNAGEHAINSESTDFWMWGQKQFNKLTMYPDVVGIFAALSSRQTYLNEFNDGKKEDNPHLVWLKKMGEV